MAYVLPILVTIDGINLQSGFTSCLQPGMLRSRVVQRDLILAAQSAAMPKYAGHVLKERQIFIDHRIVNDGSHEANLLTLKGIYDPASGERTLIWTDGDGINKTCTIAYVDFYLDPGVAGIFADYHAFVGVWVLLSGDFPWSSTSSVTAAAKTSSPAMISVANAGNITSPHVIYTAQPTAQKTAANGQKYARFINVLWRTERATPSNGWPVLVRTFDHAAEVTAGRSLATGDDVELYDLSGTRVDCWASTHTSKTWNTATCDVWVNYVGPPARYWTYTNSATLSAVATSMTPAIGEMATMPATPFFIYWEDSAEVSQVTAFDGAAGTMTITRNARNTAATTHVTGTKAYWMPVAYEMTQGWTGAPSRSTYIQDDYKPIFLTGTAATADNTSWTMKAYFESYVANDLTVQKPRTGSWRIRVVPENQREKHLGRGDQYWRYAAGPTGNPSTTLSLDYKGTAGGMGLPLADGFEWSTPIGLSSFTDTYTVGIGYATSLKGRGEAWMVDRSGLSERMGVMDADIAASGTPTYTPAISAYAMRFVVYPYDVILDNFVNVVALEPAVNAGWDIAVGAVANFVSTDRPSVTVESSNRNIYQIGRPDAPATLANTDGDTLSLYGIVLTLSDTLTIDVAAGTVTNTTRNMGVRNRCTGTLPGLPDGTHNITYTEAGLSGGASITLGVSQFQSASN